MGRRKSIKPTPAEGKEPWSLRFGRFSKEEALRAAAEIAAGREVSADLLRMLLSEGAARIDASGCTSLTADGVLFLQTGGDPSAPTPDKLRTDAIGKLLKVGSLHKGHAIAASEIEEVHFGWTRSIIRVQDFKPKIIDTPRTLTQQDQISRLTRREARLWSRFYSPWSRKMGALRYAGYSHLELSLMVVIDNYGPRQLEDMLRLRHGTVLPIIRDALWAYCAIAGISP